MIFRRKNAFIFCSLIALSGCGGSFDPPISVLPDQPAETQIEIQNGSIADDGTSNEFSNSLPQNPTQDAAQSLGLTIEELAYLSLLFSNAGLAFDLSEIPRDNDGDAIPNSVDDDIDGDGIANADDDDIDGDGTPNSEDDDIDDDDIENDDDDDIDGDGIANDDDPDADSDGLSDRWDLDDDSDGTDDDEDEDDMDDEPKSRLEDLVDRVAQRGWLTDAEQLRIARELARRFDKFNEVIELYSLIERAERLNEQPGRPAPANGFARDISAVDEIYKQLAGAVEEAKRGQFNPDGPIANRTRLRRALTAFKARATALVTSAEVFGLVRFDEIGDAVEELGTSLGQDRLAPFADGLRGRIPQDVRGVRDEERREFGLYARGGSRIGSAFQDAEANSILAGIGVLRTLVTPEDGGSPSDEDYDRLLDRLDELKEDNVDIELADAVARIVAEEMDE